MQNPHPGRDTRYQRGGVPIGLCPLLDGLPWRGGFFRGVVRAFFGGVERLRLPDLLIGLGRRDLSRLLVGKVTGGAGRLVGKVTGGAGRLRVPDLLIGIGRRDLSRLLVGKVTGGAGRRCLARLLIPKRVEKILLGRRDLL